MAERSRKQNRPASAPSAQGGSSLSAVAAQGYFEASKRPLEILFFLLPFIAFYEYELARVLRSPDGLVTNEAHLALLTLFEAFEIQASALSLPGFLLVAILLIWHALSRGPWIVDLSVVARMFLESAALALPLLVIAQFVARSIPEAGPMPAAGVEDFGSLPLGAQIAVAVGAGLYEELAFRMVGFGVLLFVFADLLAVPKKWAMAAAIGLSALAFAVYHPLRGPDGGFLLQRFVFFLLAGAYFGIAYALRGFGIVAATHALYDIATALIVARAADAT
ncbi:MAG: type II CAAX prenyl endopeptidase Rce1 family protein [Planctomycetota bacterium]